MPKGKYQSWLTPAGQRKLIKWASEGLVDREMASRMGISESTFYEWQNKYSEISESIKKGKDRADSEVQAALFKACTGYFVEESITENGTVTKSTRKWVKPDVTACIFWLKCRQSSAWNDKIAEENETASACNIVVLPARKPVTPPPDMTNRDDIISYYNAEMQKAAQETFDEYGS